MIMATYFFNVSTSSSNTEQSTSASSTTSSCSGPGRDPLGSSFSSVLGGSYRNISYKNLPCGVNSAAYRERADEAGKLGVTKLDFSSPTGSLNLRTSFVNKPCKNLIVSGPRNRTTDRVLRRDASGPTSSRWGFWDEKGLIFKMGLKDRIEGLKNFIFFLNWLHEIWGWRHSRKKVFVDFLGWYVYLETCWLVEINVRDWASFPNRSY